MSRTGMTEDDLLARIETLETRAMHQDVSIDELTRTLLAQEQLLKKQSETLKRLEDQLKGLADLHPGESAAEPPPPHY